MMKFNLIEFLKTIFGRLNWASTIQKHYQACMLRQEVNQPRARLHSEVLKRPFRKEERILGSNLYQSFNK